MKKNKIIIFTFLICFAIFYLSYILWFIILFKYDGVATYQRYTINTTSEKDIVSRIDHIINSKEFNSYTEARYGKKIKITPDSIHKKTKTLYLKDINTVVDIEIENNMVLLTSYEKAYPVRDKEGYPIANEIYYKGNTSLINVFEIENSFERNVLSKLGNYKKHTFEGLLIWYSDYFFWNQFYILGIFILIVACEYIITYIIRKNKKYDY